MEARNSAQARMNVSTKIFINGHTISSNIKIKNLTNKETYSTVVVAL